VNFVNRVFRVLVVIVNRVFRVLVVTLCAVLRYRPTVILTSRVLIFTYANFVMWQ